MPAHRTCLFSTYFKGRMPNFVRFYCEELREYFTRLVLIIHEELSVDDRGFIERIGGIDPVIVENVGFDYGAWHKTIHLLDGAERAGFFNDSCICFRKLTKFFKWFEDSSFGWGGLTDNLEFHHHIQTYAVLMRQQVIVEVQKFFYRTGLITDKFQVIQQYEIGLSRYLKTVTKIGCMFDCRAGGVNHTMIKPAELIARGFPMIKRRLPLQDFMPILQNAIAYGVDNINLEYLLEGAEYGKGDTNY